MNTREMKAKLEREESYRNYAARMEKKHQLVAKLESNNIKFNFDEIIAIDENKHGEIFFLERGNAKAGYKHVLSHLNDFKNKGLTVKELPGLLMHTLKENQKIAAQGGKAKRTTRPIYRSTCFSEKKVALDIAISVGNNGFIVGANPTASKK